MLQVDSKPVTLREANCEARRQRILEAARDLMAEGGAQSFTMRRLAERAGLSVTTLYNLIGGRDEIAAALVSDAIDRMDGTLERDAPIEDPLLRCRAVVTVSVAYVAANEAVFRPLAQELSLETIRTSPADARIATRASRMQSVAIRAAVEQGLLRDLLDPEVLGSQIYHGWEGAFTLWGKGRLDEAGFRARALYGLYVALLGVAADQVRPMIEDELRSLEQELLEASQRVGGEQRKLA